MVNINKLKGKIVESGLTIEEMADKLMVDRSTLYRKFEKNGEKITVYQAQQIARILKLTNQEAMEIFFAQDVA